MDTEVAVDSKAVSSEGVDVECSEKVVREEGVEWWEGGEGWNPWTKYILDSVSCVSRRDPWSLVLLEKSIMSNVERVASVDIGVSTLAYREKLREDDKDIRGSRR